MNDLTREERIDQIIAQVERNAGHPRTTPNVPDSLRPTPRRIQAAVNRIAIRFNVDHEGAELVLTARDTDGDGWIATSYIVLAENHRRWNLY